MFQLLKGGDLMVERKKTEKEIANEKSKRILQGVACWASFYRY